MAAPKQTSCSNGHDASEWWRNDDGVARCRACGRENFKRHYGKSAGVRQKRVARFRGWLARNRKAWRDDALQHYGGRCRCCGESRTEFLTIDHINGGGSRHRAKVGNIYRWLKANEYPDGFRVLCMNCNWSLGLRKYCPHDRERDTRKEA